MKDLNWRETKSLPNRTIAYSRAHYISREIGFVVRDSVFAAYDRFDAIGSKSIKQGKNMDTFKIKVTRIEMISPNERGEDISLTFQFEGRQTAFILPIYLNSREFDDTEIVKVARSKLHDVFSQLSSQCEDWQLTDEERRELARISLRPT